MIAEATTNLLGFQDNYVRDPLRTVCPKKKTAWFEQSYGLLGEGVSFVAGQEAPKGVKTLRNTPAPAPDSENAMDISTKFGVTRRDGVVPELPSGYNYDDYDAVCGLARGYNAWGASHHMIPCQTIEDQIT